MNQLLYTPELVQWLNQSPARAWANGITRGFTLTIPIVQWIHILAACAIVGTVVMIGLRMMGFLKFSPPLADMARRLLPWTWVAIAVNVVTGVFMVIDRPSRALNGLTFPYKMIFLVVATGLAIWFAIALRGDPEYWDRTPGRRSSARVLGAVTVLLWIGVIVAGRWIYYARGV